MKVLKSSLIVLLLSLSLCACSNKDNNVNITSEVLQTVKSAAAQEEMHFPKGFPLSGSAQIKTEETVEENNTDEAQDQETQSIVKDTDKKEEAGTGRRATPIKAAPTTRRTTIATPEKK